MNYSEFDHTCMRKALELAQRGRGFVEPNPLVGCVLAAGNRIIGQGWHRRFGDSHAEVEALSSLSNLEQARGATAYVTLEPCCHQGKTPACTKSLIAAGISRVVAAMRDPFPQVDGGGIAELTAAGVQTDVGLMEKQSRTINAPYLMLLEQQRPWTMAKWAMTLDGKIATVAGDSRWISCEQSRTIVHRLRGRVDAIIVGRGTAQRDDPLLTARPAGPRSATRIVLDTHASLPLTHQLIRTAHETPVLFAVGPTADAASVNALRAAGCEVWQHSALDPFARLANLWRELGQRRMTNVLVEGGAKLLGSLFDAQLIDEAHIFIAPKLIGGLQAPSPIAGQGIDLMARAYQLSSPHIEQIHDDVYIHGHIRNS